MSNPGNEKFKDILNDVNKILTNEQTNEDQSQLINDINSNSEGNQLLAQDRQLKEFVKAKLTRQKPSDQFLKDLKNKIKSNLS